MLRKGVKGDCMYKGELKEIILIVAIISVGVLVMLMPGITDGIKQTRTEKYSAMLCKAEELILEGDWDEADDLVQKVGLGGTNDHRVYDKKIGLEYFIWAENDLRNNDIESAVTHFSLAEHKKSLFSYEVRKLFEEQRRDTRSMLIAQRSEKSKKQPSVRSDVPYVGMPESEIGKTKLGAPSENVRHNGAMLNGKSYSANLYDFYKNNKYIFTARCINGRVTQVWDYRDDDSDFDPTYTGESRFKYVDVDEYSDVYEFYYYYYDDFYDFEEAEDYYYSHGGR